MEQEAQENTTAAVRVSTKESGDDMTNIAVADLDSYVNVELSTENNAAGHNVLDITQGLCHVLSLNNIKTCRFNVTPTIPVLLARIVTS